MQKNEEQNIKKSGSFNCRSCSLTHVPRNCPAYGKRYNKCKKYHHFQKMCRNKWVKEIEENGSQNNYEELEEFSVTCISVNEINSKAEWLEVINVEGQEMEVKIDTAAQINVMSKDVLSKLLKNKSYRLTQTKVILETYKGFKITPLSSIELKCQYSNKNSLVNFIVIGY